MRKDVIKSQGLKVGKDDLYLWANYICDIFLFVRIPKYDRSLIKGKIVYLYEK